VEPAADHVLQITDMPAAVSAGDWLAGIDQVSRCHAVLTLVHLNAQTEPNPVSDIQPVQNMAPEMGRFLIVLGCLSQFDSLTQLAQLC